MTRFTRHVVCGLLLSGLITLGSVSAALGTSHRSGVSHRRGAAAREQAFNSVVASRGARASATHTPDDGDLADEAAQYSNERSAPGSSVSGQALIAAVQQANGMNTTGSAWQEFTNQPYNANPSNYTDPFWSNVGSGFGLVGGRTTALAQTPNGHWFAGTADGGVWRSTNQGQSWTPVFDSMPSLSIGALSVNPTDGSLWVGTGEANVSQDSYA